MSEEELQQWFQEIWADREERIYPAFFGGIPPAGVYALTPKVFEAIGKTDPDPRFLTHLVLEYPPAEGRGDWLYVSSGMSNPWGESPETVNPRNYSGLGFEFTLHTRQQARWAVQLLHHLMAVQLLVAAGEVQGHLVERNDRIPLGGALWKRDGQVTQLLVAEPPAPPAGYPPALELASGKVDLMLLVGITDRESEFIRTQGVEALIPLLRAREIFPVTDPERLSVL